VAAAAVLVLLLVLLLPRLVTQLLLPMKVSAKQAVCSNTQIELWRRILTTV
jgi:hypothetical protein